LHLYLFNDAGQLIQPRQITVRLTETAQQIGPINVALQPAGPGHYLGEDMGIPAAGRWTLTVGVRFDEFTSRIATTDFRVR
jgi:copper transport protein